MRFTCLRVLLLAILAQRAQAAVEVLVRTADGAPAAGAVVCVGTAQDLVQYGRAMTDAQGRATIATNAPLPHVYTASLDGRGTQQRRSELPAVGGPASSFSVVSLTLPSARGGPACPTGPAGPERPLVSSGALATFTPPVRPAAGFVELRKTEFCFGALGMQCGQPQPPMPLTALCAGGSCFINGGSWDHDECCWANPRGMACRSGPLDAVTGHDGHCVAAWDKALRLVRKGLNWKRDVDFSRGNATGSVEFAIYCAPANTLVPPEDGRRCCSRRTRALRPAEAVAAAAAGETLVACE